MATDLDTTDTIEGSILPNTPNPRSLLTVASSRYTGLLLLMMLLVLGPLGCGAPGSTPSTTSSEPVSTSTTVAPDRLSNQKEVARTARVANELARQLQEKSASEQDPAFQATFGVLYALRARMEALGVQAALASGRMDMADASMRNVHLHLAKALSLAGGAVAPEIDAAAEIVSTLATPSDDPERASVLLDEFITSTAGLLDQSGAPAATEGS